MENISHPQWKPTEVEHTYLLWELGKLGNTIMNLPDSFICGQLYSAFRAHFGPADPNIPAYDYLVRITQDSRRSLGSTPATFDLTPTSFGGQDLSNPALAINLFGGYMDPLQHNLIPSGTLNNTPVQLNNSTVDFNQGAGPSYPDYFLPNMPHETNDQMREARHESPTIKGSSIKENLDDITMERTEAIVSQSLAKSGGRQTEKNMFYPNKTTASILYGKSIQDAIADVDERIRLNPSLQGQRVKLINEERTARWNRLSNEEQQVWVDKAKAHNDLPPDFGTVDQKYKILKAKIQQVHQHANDAFALPVVSMVFLPADGYERPRAMIFDCHSDGRESFTDWLKATHGRKVLANFLSYVDDFANAVSVSVKQPDDDENLSDTANVVSMVAKDDPVIWRNGIHYLPHPKGMVAGPLRAAYRTGIFERWLICGWADKKMPWARVSDKPENFIQPKVLARGLTVKLPEKSDVHSLRRVVEFFVDHQEGRIPYEEGLFFMGCGSGSMLHYPTKRPGLTNKRKPSGARANQDDPDSEEEFPSPTPSPTPTPALAPIPLPDTTTPATTAPPNSEMAPITPAAKDAAAPATTAPPNSEMAPITPAAKDAAVPATTAPPNSEMAPITPAAKDAAAPTTTATHPVTNPATNPTTNPDTNPAPTTTTTAKATRQNRPSAASLALAVELTTLAAQNKLTRRGGGYDYDRDDAQRDFFVTSDGQEGLARMYDRVAARNDEEEEEEEGDTTITIKQERDAAVPTRRTLEMPPRRSVLAWQSDLMLPPAAPTAPAAVATAAVAVVATTTAPTNANPTATDAPTKTKKKPGRKPKASTTVASTTPPTDTPASISTDTNAIAPANLTPPDPTNTLPNNPVAAAPKRMTRQKRTAENAGIDESEVSVSTGSRKSQRRA